MQLRSFQQASGQVSRPRSTRQAAAVFPHRLSVRPSHHAIGHVLALDVRSCIRKIIQCHYEIDMVPKSGQVQTAATPLELSGLTAVSPLDG